MLGKGTAKKKKKKGEEQFKVYGLMMCLPLFLSPLGCIQYSGLDIIILRIVFGKRRCYNGPMQFYCDSFCSLV